MDENKSDIKEKNKDEIWYGWIPKLSHEIVVTPFYRNKFFDEVTKDDLREVFKSEYMLMSDKIFDRLFNRQHYVEFSDHDISVCECCGEKVWCVTVDIKGKNDKSLIKGTANIHKSGLVRYEIHYNKVARGYFINKAQDIHKIVRDHLHFHLFHSSDMPLPPVKVDETCDEDLAKENILRMFLDAFIAYKMIVNKVGLAEGEEDILRALGEIIYANSALDKFSERKYLFSWDDVPKDNEELIKFLSDELKINWVEKVENTEIKKIDDKTITVTYKNNNANSIIIKLNKAEKKINLEISGKRYEYILKEENGKLNIYKEKTYEEFKKSFENFDRAFKVLLQKTINRRNRISQFIVLLSSIIAVFALIQYVRLFSFPYSDEVIILSLLLLIFIVLHLLTKIYGLRRAQK